MIGSRSSHPHGSAWRRWQAATDEAGTPRSVPEPTVEITGNLFGHFFSVVAGAHSDLVIAEDPVPRTQLSSSSPVNETFP